MASSMPRIPPKPRVQHQVAPALPFGHHWAPSLRFEDRCAPWKYSGQKQRLEAHFGHCLEVEEGLKSPLALEQHSSGFYLSSSCFAAQHAYPVRLLATYYPCLPLLPIAHWPGSPVTQPVAPRKYPHLHEPRAPWSRESVVAVGQRRGRHGDGGKAGGTWLWVHTRKLLLGGGNNAALYHLLDLQRCKWGNSG